MRKLSLLLGMKEVYLGSGGGKCFAFLGAIRALVEEGQLSIPDVELWGGVSGGAMVAAMFCAGMQLREMTEFVLNLAVDKLVEPIEEELLFDEFGLNNGEKVVVLFREIFREKLGLEDPTFLQLYEATRKRLLIQATNLTRYDAEVFSHETHPDLPVSLAVRMSSCIPFLFTPVKWKDCLYVDGAIIRPTIAHDGGPDRLTLCVRTNIVPHNEGPANLIEYTMGVIRCFYYLHEPAPLVTSNLYCFSFDEGVGLAMDKQVRAALIETGYRQTLADLKRPAEEGVENKQIPQEDGEEGCNGSTAANGAIAGEGSPSHLADSHESDDLHGEETSEVERQVNQIEEHGGVIPHGAKEDESADDNDGVGNHETAK